MTTAAAKPIETVVVEPAIDRDVSSARPTEIRYGWCPFGDINLIGPDGTPWLYVHPITIDGPDGPMENPYYRKLPQGQLIPFPTFNAITSMPSPDQVDSNGRAILVQSVKSMPALLAATAVLASYSSWGFVILDSLQGLDQALANAIFKVVHPFRYRLEVLESELDIGAPARIESTAPIAIGDYRIEPLASEYERTVARQLAAEMASGASIAVALANDILNQTAASIIERVSGGEGKTGPDPLDKRLCVELGRELPNPLNEKKNESLGELKGQIDFLVGREASRADKERIAELEAKVAAMESGESLLEEIEQHKAALPTCGFVRPDGSVCKRTTKGGRCQSHPLVEEVTV